MFKGALIVWTTNWQYYEKHHKTQQLERLSSYQKSIKLKLLSANSILYQSTINGLNIVVNPSRYIGFGFVERLSLPKIISDILSNRNSTTESISSENEQDD